MANARRGPVKLPSTICLQPIDAMNAAQVRDALNASRSNVAWWRKHACFPRGFRTGNNVMISTADLAGWCASRGLKIEWL